MKRIIFSIIIVGVTFFKSQAQALTINELIEKTKCSDSVCFNDFIIPKSFKFLSSDTMGSQNYFYTSKAKTYNPNTGIFTEDIASIKFKKGEAVTTEFITNKRETYIALMKEIKSSDFTIFKPENSDCGSTHYLSKSYPDIKITVKSTIKITEGKGYNEFSFIVNRKG